MVCPSNVPGNGVAPVVTSAASGKEGVPPTCACREVCCVSRGDTVYGAADGLTCRTSRRVQPREAPSVGLATWFVQRWELAKGVATQYRWILTCQPRCLLLDSFCLRAWWKVTGWCPMPGTYVVLGGAIPLILVALAIYCVWVGPGHTWADRAVW